MTLASPCIGVRSLDACDGRVLVRRAHAIKPRSRGYLAACGSSSTCAQASCWQQAARLSAMMRRIVRAQAAHLGLQPRQPYTWFAVAGRAGALSIADRTSRSEKTLQGQTIMRNLGLAYPANFALI